METRPPTIAFAPGVSRLYEAEPLENREDQVILQFSGKEQSRFGRDEFGLESRTVGIMRQLYQDPDSMSDVALLLQGSLVKTHRFVLAMSSPYFKKVFEVR